jgi:hypothetical protein
MGVAVVVAGADRRNQAEKYRAMTGRIQFENRGVFYMLSHAGVSGRQLAESHAD